MKITLTEALAKLKTYNKQISKLNRQLDEVSWLIDYSKGGSKKGALTSLTYDELKKEGEAKLQKLLALIHNRNKLKGVISQTNAITKVKIGKYEYTIVQAIERKNSISIEKEFLTYLTNQYYKVKKVVDDINMKAENKANDIVEAQVQAEAKNKKTEEIEALFNLIYNKNKAEIIDPLNLKDFIDNLSEDIDTFEQNVDVALSIVNANTYIEIDL